ncbi:MAG: outer membrane protein assembly factor BamA [Hyphococcus sp.]|nr:MAG: outer membrane protein assembly factor BamA [Marinicaulis sp.]
MSLNKSGGGANSAFLFFAAAMLSACSYFVASDAMAQTPASGQSALTLDAPTQAPVIQAISITGNQRVEAQTVGSYLPLQVGMRAEQALLDLSLKTLFNTGLFSDVELAMQPTGTLAIEVTENPIVNQVLYEGNKKIKEDKIVEEIQLTARSIYTRAKVQADVQRIIELYRAKGRFAATVTPKVTPLPQNRIDVIYEIDEGPKTGVAKVNFVGNTIYTDNELRGVILTKESRWWRFFSSNDNYDPDRLEYERELLRQHYGKNGYADFKVLSAVAELTPDRKDFFITFTMEEGPQYTIGEVKVKTTLAKLDEETLVRYVPMRTGNIFDTERVEKAVEAITFATGFTGYAFVDVNPRLERIAETNTMNVTFQVNEGPRVYVERINIKGNQRTLDKVIRREIRVAEGDAFNRVLIDRSRARVRSLGFFSEVEFEERPGSAPDRTEVDVNVKEQATGSFSVGVGVSSTENFVVDLSVEERNLMGRGQLLRFRAQASSRTRNVDIQFNQPYFLGRNLTAGVSAFNQRTDFRESGFIRDRIGFGTSAGFQISEYGRGGLNYLFTRDDVTIDINDPFQLPLDVDPLSLLAAGAVPISIVTTDSNGAQLTDNGQADGDPVQIVTANRCDFLSQSFNPTCQSRGKFVTSLVGASLSFDTRNDPITPTRGWRAGGAVRFAGVGGDVNYYQGEVSAAYYHPLFAGFVGVLKGRAGYIEGYGGDDVRLSDRFFEGASSFRGFEVAGVGPRLVDRFNDKFQPDGQALGAKAYAIGTFEIVLPLPIPDSYGLRAALFSDFGTVGLLDDSTKAFNSSSIPFEVPLFGENGTVLTDEDGNRLIDYTLDRVQDDLALRVTAGISINWDSPFGPIRFDIAEVIRKEVYDQAEGFRFSAGTSF